MMKKGQINAMKKWNMMIQNFQSLITQFFEKKTINLESLPGFQDEGNKGIVDWPSLTCITWNPC